MTSHAARQIRLGETVDGLRRRLQEAIPSGIRLVRHGAVRPGGHEPHASTRRVGIALAEDRGAVCRPGGAGIHARLKVEREHAIDGELLRLRVAVPYEAGFAKDWCELAGAS